VQGEMKVYNCYVYRKHFTRQTVAILRESVVVIVFAKDKAGETT